MPTRRALLVASPDAHDLLPGARQDVSNYEDFLRSTEGGAWEHGEITKLFNPTKKNLFDAVSALSGYDYVFITFSGHGTHHVGKDLSESSVELNKYESCYVYEINPRNKRHLVVVDSCRAVVSITEELIKRSLTALNAAMTEITRDQSRRLLTHDCQREAQRHHGSGRGISTSRRAAHKGRQWAAGATFRRIRLQPPNPTPPVCGYISEHRHL